jgi:phosphonate transport system substrate-binding protein
VLPDESEESLRKRYAGLLAHLSEQLGVPVELHVPHDYASLVSSFSGGEIDLAYFGGVTFIRAKRLHHAIPLVMRDVDLRFTSYFFARLDVPGDAVADFRGRSFSFGSELSTSGHLMPRHFLRRMDIVPEQFFASVAYSGGHDQTAYAVRDGRVDLGAANAEIVEKMQRDGRLDRGEIRIVWITPPYADYVWAARPELSEAFRRRLRDAFLSLDPGNEHHAKVLSGMGTGGFLPASDEDFALLERTMLELAELRSERSAGNAH